MCFLQHGQTSLMLAILKRHREVVELLLDNKADVNTMEKVGGNRLHSTLSKCMPCADVVCTT